MKVLRQFHFGILIVSDLMMHDFTCFRIIYFMFIMLCI